MKFRDINRDKYFNLAEAIYALRDQHYELRAEKVGIDCICNGCCYLRSMSNAILSVSSHNYRETLLLKISELDPIKQREIFQEMKRYLEKLS